MVILTELNLRSPARISPFAFAFFMQLKCSTPSMPPFIEHPPEEAENSQIKLFPFIRCQRPTEAQNTRPFRLDRFNKEQDEEVKQNQRPAALLEP